VSVSQGNWIRIASVGDVAESDVQRCDIETQCIALYNIGGKLYATDDICTHAHAHLSDGYIDGDKVECPLHQGLFHIPTGKALSPPVTENLKTYPVKVVDGDVLIDL
jgi:naphthalene 1,2-dioxygenase system ferredoxin subunit